MVFGTPEDGQGSPPDRIEYGSVSLLDWSGKIHDTRLGFFDSTTGVRVAYLRIECVSREFGHAGPFRVAWKPQVILDHLTIDITAAAAWPSVAGEAFNMLPSGRGSVAVVIRNLTLRIPAWNGLVIEAPLARLTETGDIVLIGATALQRDTPRRSLTCAVVPLVRPISAVYLAATERPGELLHPAHPLTGR